MNVLSIPIHDTLSSSPTISNRFLLLEAAVLRIRFRIRIRMLLGLLDPDPDPPVRGTDPDPDPSIIKQKY